MITSDNRDFLDGIARDFARYRDLMKEEEVNECLCEGCQKQCGKILNLSECNKSYDKFLCYIEDNKCITEASNKFCNKCKTTEQTIRQDISLFKYQLFLEDYMNQLNEIPNDKIMSRGLLVFHGLGSGKTCSGILLANSCRRYGGGKRRNIILMIPASLLLDPWIKELMKLNSKCNSDIKLKRELQKVRQAYKNKNEDEIKKAYKKACEKNGVFILHYNADGDGGWKDEIMRIKRDYKQIGSNVFDNAVIVIDEVHNFTNSLVNIKEKKNKVQRKMTKKELYLDIFRARNARVVLLTGTPVFNKPVELAYVFNMIRGSIDNRPEVSLPIDEQEFNEMFVRELGRGQVEVRNPNMFRRRINGLVSYYRGANKNQFARKVIDNVFVPLSSEQASNYLKVYESEIKREAGQISKGLDINKVGLDSQMISNVSLPSYIFNIVEQKNYKDNRNNRLTKNGKAIKILEVSKRNAGLASRKDYDKVLTLIDNDDKPLHINNELSTISRKMYHAYKRIMASNGPVLFFSRFEGIYGIQMFAEVLRQNGYIDFDKIKADDKIAEVARRKSLPEDNGEYIKGTYILWTGNHRINKSREMYNLFENRRGDIIKCFLMTEAGKEGINLYGVRQVHILEPWWNEVRDDQVIGRAVRLCSHSHIPKEEFIDYQIKDPIYDGERIVNVFKYYGLLDMRPSGYVSSGKITSNQMIEDIKSAQREMMRKSADYLMYSVSTKKKNKTEKFLDLMKQSAIDCYINGDLNKDEESGKIIECFRDPDFENYFDSWDIKDDAKQERKVSRSEFRILKYEGKVYYRDLNNNVYERKQEEGNILKPVGGLNYKKIGVYDDIRRNIIFDNVKLDLEKKERLRLNNKFVKHFDNKAIKISNKKVLMIGSSWLPITELMMGGVKLDVYFDGDDNKERIKEHIKKTIGVKLVDNIKKGYFLTYIQKFENWKKEIEKMSDLIIILKSGIQEEEYKKIIYSIEEFDKKHYIINRRLYKTKFFESIVKLKNSKKVLEDLPSYITTYDKFGNYLKEMVENDRYGEVPLSLEKLRRDYIFSHKDKFIKEEMKEIFKKLKHKEKVLFIDEGLFTLEKFNKSKLISRDTKADLRSKKKIKKEIKEFDKVILDARVMDMIRLKESTTINITLNRENMLKVIPKKKVVKKKSKIGEPCKTTEDCARKKPCVENKCASVTKPKKKKKKKSMTIKKAKSLFKKYLKKNKDNLEDLTKEDLKRQVEERDPEFYKANKKELEKIIKKIEKKAKKAKKDKKKGKKSKKKSKKNT